MCVYVGEVESVDCCNAINFLLKDAWFVCHDRLLEASNSIRARFVKLSLLKRKRPSRSSTVRRPKHKSSATLRIQKTHGTVKKWGKFVKNFHLITSQVYWRAAEMRKRRFVSTIMWIAAVLKMFLVPAGRHNNVFSST